jgi:hypothetical protein
MKVVIQVYIVDQIIKSFVSVICEKHAIRYFGSTVVIEEVSFFIIIWQARILSVLCNYSNFYQLVFFMLDKFCREVSLVKLVFEV